MKNNKITIFTITFNCEMFIERCYKSILNQSYSDWIWLIIDDGSIDNSEKIIKELMDNRIHYFKIINNVGRGRLGILV